MNLSLEKYQIALVIAPVDGRSGFDKLASIARLYCHIDVDEKKDAIVFLSRRCNVCKIIFRDERGRTLITRWLNQGCFERFLQRENETPKTNLTRNELMKFLDGANLQHRPRGI